MLQITHVKMLKHGSLNARDRNLNGKFKFKPDYIAATVASNQAKLQANINKFNIPIHSHVSLDETMVWHDFCIQTKTLSLPGRFEPVIWIPNDKDTTTLIVIWYYNKLSLIFTYGPLGSTVRICKQAKQSRDVSLVVCVVKESN